MVIIPFNDIAPETLNALLEELASRDGTDYGDVEVSLELKVNQIKHQLRSGEACLCYDNATESCNVLPADVAKKLIADSHV